MRFSSVCTFSCPDGFTTDVTAPQTASRSLTCQLTGEWDAQAPQCRGKRFPVPFVLCLRQESITGSEQLPCARVTVFSRTSLFLERF